MRTSRTAGISFIIAIVVLLIATVAGAKTGDRPDATSKAAPGQEGGSPSAAPGSGDGTPAGGSVGGAPGGAGMTCIKQDPNCNDSGFGAPPTTGEDGSPIPCGQPIVSGNGPDGTVAYAPCPGEERTPVEPQPQVVTPKPGMADVTPRSFDTATVGDDDRTLNVDFWSGVAPCDVLDHVDVSYGADAVTLTLFAGHDPSAGNVVCIDIAQFERVVVTLDEPLNGRTIVDGALGKDAQAA